MIIQYLTKVIACYEQIFPGKYYDSLKLSTWPRALTYKNGAACNPNIQK